MTVVIAVVLLALVVAGIYLLTTEGQGSVFDRLDSKYDPDLGKFRANYRTERSQARTVLKQALQAEKEAVITDIKIDTFAQELEFENQHTHERLEDKEHLGRRVNVAKVAEQENIIELTNAATSAGTNVETLIEDQKVGMRLYEQREAKKIEVKTHKKMKAVDFEYWLKEKDEDVKTAIISTLLPHFQAKQLTTDLFELLDKAYQLEQGNDPQKVEKLKIVKKQIRLLREVVDGKQKQLRDSNG